MARRRRAVALATLLAAAALLAAHGGAQSGASGEPTDLRSSECWTCHRPGGTVEGTPLRSMYSVHPPATLALRGGEPAPLRLVVANDWFATLHRITGSLDLAAAPSLGFEATPEPILGVTRTGTLAFVPAAIAQPERSVVLAVPVPAGATDVRVRLAPERASGPDAPDLAMRVWGDGVAADPATARVVDAPGKGAAEVLHLTDPQGIAALGYGNWTVAAVHAGFGARPDAAALVDQPFSVTVDAWFNLTGERTQVAASTARLDGRSDGPATTFLEWRLFAHGTPGPGEEIRVTVDAVASFEHPPQFSAVDDWAFTQTVRIPIAAAPDPGTGGPGTTITFNATPPPPAPPSPSGPLLTERSIAEAVGYFTAFVLTVSLVTGGAFGGALRRLLNRLLGSAQRRVAFHNLSGYGVLLAAAAHTGLFLHEAEFPWTLGLLWGGLAILALAVLGVTGAWQVSLIRAWSYDAWARTHLATAWTAIACTLLHIALDGIHFTAFQKAVGWRDPFT